MKDSLWSVDLFRCESLALRIYWVLVMMDQFTRRIIGFAVRRGPVDGLTLRSEARRYRDMLVPITIRCIGSTQWQANLRVLEVTEIKTVPYVPLSRRFVERLIGTVRREYLDQMLLWTRTDIEDKVLEFQHYYNGHRTHEALGGGTPDSQRNVARSALHFSSYRCSGIVGGLYQTPVGA
jgi:putative transposase